MNIKGLRAFVHIMERGTLVAAAAEMNISPPALSRQLTLLESELGILLFSREKSRLEPTAEGTAFYSEAEWILDSIDQVPKMISEIKLQPRQRLRITVMPRIAARITTAVVAQMVEENHAIAFAVDMQSRRFLERGVADGKCDFAVGALPAFHSAIETETICKLPAVAVLHSSHPLAGRDTVRIEDLVKTPFISMPPSTLIQRQANQIFARAGVEPEVQILVTHTQLACNLVAHNAGFTITEFDQSVPPSYDNLVRMVPIVPVFPLHFGMHFRKGAKRTLATQRFCALMHRQGAILEKSHEQ